MSHTVDYKFCEVCGKTDFGGETLYWVRNGVFRCHADLLLEHLDLPVETFKSARPNQTKSHCYPLSWVGIRRRGGVGWCRCDGDPAFWPHRANCAYASGN